ncbi:MarR family winged helix-turn-helix transcriptional regulator [Marinobacter sp. JSM 1782161]|uniref:MarR family winged helix-turn-helix transcriptional regulator n=1 Tax=Marinobacter sp. JSM 1782161 TaxID=2685906 RepID=UPI001402CBFC|nr:MarR family transcriptional regulator [Marinobacter sp. JSM 1782161]
MSEANTDTRLPGHDDLTLSIHTDLKPSLGGALGRLHRLWRRAITESVADLGMTESRWAVMVHLVKIGEGCSQQQLARELEIEMPSLTRTLNQLEELDLLERRPDPHDRRAHRLWLTETGRDRVALMERRILDVRAAICEGVTQQQADVFADLLTLMEANVRRHLEQDQKENPEP